MTKKKYPYKSAKELGLTQEQWEALIKTQVALENDQIKHAIVTCNNITDSSKSTFCCFNMGYWSDKIQLKNGCGTAMCIGGTAEFLAKKPVFHNGNGNIPEALDGLFYPQAIGDWDRLTPKIAAKAIHRYLSTGDDGQHCWKVAMGEA